MRNSLKQFVFRLQNISPTEHHHRPQVHLHVAIVGGTEHGDHGVVVAVGVPKIDVENDKDIIEDDTYPSMIHSWLLMMRSRLLFLRNCFVTSGPHMTDIPLGLSVHPSSS